MVFRQCFSRRWWWTTLIVLAGMAFLVSLGRWQLDRLEQRRVYNAAIARQLAAPPLDLSTLSALDESASLADRRASVVGEFDFAHQIVLLNQNLDGQPGAHLVTPLRIQGSDRAVLVDRGWIPAAQAHSPAWAQFDGPGATTVTGYLQRSEKLPGGRTTPIPATPLAEWHRVDIEALQAQMPYDLLPIYLVQTPGPGRDPYALPRRVERQVDLSEGSHLSYALQWFAFAIILGVGYIQFVRKHEAQSFPVAVAAPATGEPLVASGKESHA